MKVQNGAPHEVGEFSQLLVRIGEGVFAETDGLITIPNSVGTLMLMFRIRKLRIVSVSHESEST